MKYLYFFIFSIGFSVIGIGQSCLPDGITFTTQGQIDSFSINYPGCNAIEGLVKIWGSEITNLDGLHGLEDVGGLFIYRNDKLTTIAGLLGVKHISGKLEITDNPVLLDLQGLDEVGGVGSDITIKNNSSLSSLKGLDALENAWSNFFILENDALVEITALRSLKSIGGHFKIIRNYKLENIQDLNHLKSIGRIFSVKNNSSLNNLNLNFLTRIDSFFLVESNSLLEEIGDFEMLDVCGGIKVENNNQLLNLGLFPQLKWLEFLDVSYNASLTSVDGFNALDSIGNGFNIIRNDNLENVSGFSNCESIKGRFEIKGNDKLFRIDAFGKLKSFGFFVKIYNNKSLEQLSLFNSVSVLQLLDFGENDKFKKFLSFPNLKQCYKLNINENPSLDFIHDFNELEEMSHFLVRHCKIVSFPRFEKLVGETEITVSRNKHLREIVSFPNAQSANISIFLNPLLEKMEGFDNLINLEMFLFADSLLTKIPSFSNVDTISSLRCSKIGLTEISGFENVKYARFIDLYELPVVKKISGFDNLRSCETLVIRENPNLMEISNFNFTNSIRRLQILSNKRLRNISISCARFHIIWVKKNTNLISFLGNFGGNEANSIVFDLNSNLKEIPTFDELESIGSIDFFSNDFISSFHFKKLKRISQHMKILGLKTLKKIDGFPVLSIAEQLNVSSNSRLENFSGFENLVSVKHLSLYNNSSLLNLDGLDNMKLQEWSGDSKHATMNIKNNYSLVDISALSNLHIANKIYIEKNNSLDNLSGLNNLREVNSLVITDNPSLSRCNALCVFIENEGVVDFSNNLDGCNEISEIDCNDFYSGHVFFDINQNGEKDSVDFPISNVFIESNITADRALSNEAGNYYFYGDFDKEYQVAPNSDLWSITTDSNSYSFVFNENTRNNLNFGLFPKNPNHNAKIHLTSNRTRCNTEVDFFLNYINEGAYIENGYFTLNFDPTMAYVSGIPFPDEIDEVNHILKWHYVEQYPFATKNIRIKFLMPNQNSTGERLKLLASVYRNTDSENILENSFEFTPLVRCSYDPNDITVMKPGVYDEHYTLKDEKLTYTVRFQNTGNDEAIDVTIKNELDESFDLSTLKILQSSHNVDASLKGNQLELYFKDIYLPDSTTNLKGSQGYISYEIEPIPEIEDFTMIHNTANIIFDSNTPVITNTAFNTMVTEIPIIVNPLHIPIAGTHKEDFIIVNYVDWKQQGFQDGNCGSKTYDGHQGTDFSLASFKAMDEGIDVMAADSGTIIAIHDGEFDRNTEWNVPLGLGNFVAIEHNGKINTYYGHLKKNSLEVAVGDKVVAGQKLGEVGSSGNSTGPHLHFEMWYDSTQVIDPFHGDCGNATTYWEDELEYDDSFWVWETGFLDFNPTLGKLMERPEHPVDGNRFFRDLDGNKKITHWELIHGLRKNDVVKYVWLKPDGAEWFNFDYEIDQDYWHYHSWAYIDINPDMPLGDWACNLYVNDSLVDQYQFIVDVWASSDDIDQNEITWISSLNGWIFNSTHKGIDKISIWSIDGKQLYHQENIDAQNVMIPISVSKGLYIAQIQLKSGNTVSMKIVN